FSLLVVDGVDLRALGDAQSKALCDWLGAGGIAIVGGGAGAASGYPFFESFTGIRAGALTDAGDITPALMAYLGVSEAALGENMLCADMMGASHVLAAPDRPLIAQTPVGEGLIYTAAFELGAKPLSLWPGASALWQRVLLKSAPDAYQRSLSAGYDNWDYDPDYDGMNAVREIPVDNPPDARPVRLLLIGFVALAGIPSYFLLKKLDKRALLWLTMPLMAVCAALLIWGISRNAGFDSPVATVYTLAALDEDGEAQVSTYAGVSSADKAPIAVSVGPGVKLTPIDQPRYDYYGDDRQIKTPNQLRYRHLRADAPAITFPAAPSWSERTVKLDAPQPFTGTFDARIWMEEDGLHTEVRNDTPYRLNGCGIITSAGYASMQDLEPGASGRATLTYLTDAERKQLKDAQAAHLNGEFTPVFDGRMTDASMNGADPAYLYRFVDALYLPEESVPDPAERSAHIRKNSGDPAGQERRMRRDRLQQRVYLWGGEDRVQAVFRFVAFSEDLGKVTPTCGGRPAERVARRALIDKAMAYDPVGPTGVVFCPRGTLAAYKAALVSGAPAIGDAVSGRESFSLAEQPMFAFELPKGMTVDELNIIGVFYGEQMPKVQLYNHKTRAWDEQRTAFINLKGKAASPYIGPDGRLYAGYVPGENVSAPGDYGLQAPYMTLTGRVKP
ncbi:MAG: hypothetical protein VB067_13595, partial [Christensenellaceae bacterium]|nr:hypothetical protein [Christensenellaceae bacterium]